MDKLRGHHGFVAEQFHQGVDADLGVGELGSECVAQQRYVTAAGTETHTAAAQNKLYGLLEQER